MEHETGFDPAAPGGGTYTTSRTRTQDMGAAAAGRADQARAGAAAGLDTVANSLHEKSDRFARGAHSAADAMAHGAEYLRNNDLATITGDLVQVIRRNPGPSMLGAAALGFMLGRALSRG